MNKGLKQGMRDSMKLSQCKEGMAVRYIHNMSMPGILTNKIKLSKLYFYSPYIIYVRVIFANGSPIFIRPSALMPYKKVR